MQEAAGSSNLKDFFDCWLDSNQPLPTLELSKVTSRKTDSSDDDHVKYVVSGHITSRGGCAPASVDVTVETAGDDDNDDDAETTKTFSFDAGSLTFSIETDGKPIRIVVNKYGFTP